MNDDPVLAFIDQQKWLAPIEQKGAELVHAAYESAGEPIKNALHGVWLGHPLHAAITDVPVGSWTAAAVLDILDAAGNTQYAPGADAAVLVGLAGAGVSALAGITDWSETQGKAQRMGAMHGLLNVAATVLYAGSCVARKSRNRGLGRALAWSGFGLVLASAWLGGAISYRQRIGVDHSPDLDEQFPDGFQPAIALSELPEGQPVKAAVAGVDVFLFRRGQRIHALANACSHLGGPLNEGHIDRDTVQCPWHGSRFCLEDGAVIDGPATHPAHVFDVRVENGQVLVRKRG